MKVPSAAVSAILVGLAVAAPTPQDIDFDAYNSIPISPAIAAPVGVVPQEVIYNPTSAASAAAAAATGSTSDLSKRQSVPCTPEPAGNYASVSPDTPASFSADSAFSSAALTAVAPSGYFLVEGFQNLNAAASDPSYLTYVSSELTDYDPSVCAGLCKNIAGCNSFNIYFERDPSLVPNAITCPNPSSVTRIKCAFFGAALTLASATNVGQYAASFEVVIAGSNTYTTAPQSLPGFTGPVALGDACIIAPPTTPGSYMGSQTFPQTQPYDPSVCAAACNAMSAYNIRHESSPGSANICVFFDAYILYKNGANGVFTCTYYTESWGPAYATNFGQYDAEGDHFTIGNSYSYSVA